MTVTEKNFRFLNWGVYKDAKSLVREIMKIVKKLPREYRFEFGSQIIRSALSVVLNIAEGSGKFSDRELNRYLSIALGSVYEILATLDVLKDTSLIKEEEFHQALIKLQTVSSQIAGFKKKLV